MFGIFFLLVVGTLHEINTPRSTNFLKNQSEVDNLCLTEFQKVYVVVVKIN